jgi:hypothetical protein
MDLWAGFKAKLLIWALHRTGFWFRQILHTAKYITQRATTGRPTGQGHGATGLLDRIATVTSSLATRLRQTLGHRAATVGDIRLDISYHVTTKLFRRAATGRPLLKHNSLQQ